LIDLGTDKFLVNDSDDADVGYLYQQLLNRVIILKSVSKIIDSDEEEEIAEQEGIVKILKKILRRKISKD
jgi:hypothetical protein